MQKGDCVKRKSYGGDIVFVIKDISGETAVLEGVEYRLIADAPLSDLEKVEAPQEDPAIFRAHMEAAVRWIERNRQIRPPFRNKDSSSEETEPYFDVPGKVLHLDGDSKYLEKSLKLYKKLHIPVDGYHVEESGMPEALYRLLPRVKPDIVVITGHDALVKNRRQQAYSLGSYKNSRHFAKAVKVARQFERNRDALTVIAGACQSHFEALLQAGANFASSPGRIMIHALDPVQIAAKISYTSIRDTVNMGDIASHTVSGIKGIGGIESRGSYRMGLPNLKTF